MFSFSGAGKGAGFILLNIVRGCNIMVFTTLAVSSAVLMVVAKMPNGYTFFSDVPMAFIIIVCSLLGLSEMGVWSTWFGIYWPTFGPNHGFTWLGGSMILMGSHILGKLSDDRFAQDKMGIIFWNVCMAAGILSYIFGFTNIIMSWWFGKREGRNIRTYRNSGAIEPERGWKGDEASKYSDSYSTSKASHASIKEERTRSIFNPFGKSKKHQISGPVVLDDVEKGNSPVLDRGSPIVPSIQRPPTLQHPAMRNTPSRYSEASHLPNPYNPSIYQKDNVV
ncbi:hypothetical protein BKA67DRAFT_166653 [Truncatella angustata]|uniref:DUF7598 domain-containing protein n=1 Tax=Truncatella angustata TaxID=152316 RepID=A0A9P8ZZ27_9PEZI|nr:uncharacterized protein BKA67DRAFT_166653 [Truncatella angustata]KAH6656747.1 hypothetical protein BKA67DRAFT_166653 [Truncatella angustata]